VRAKANIDIVDSLAHVLGVKAADFLKRPAPAAGGGADVPPLPAFETAIRKAGFSIVVS